MAPQFLDLNPQRFSLAMPVQKVAFPSLQMGFDLEFLSNLDLNRNLMHLATMLHLNRRRNSLSWLPRKICNDPKIVFIFGADWCDLDCMGAQLPQLIALLGSSQFGGSKRCHYLGRFTVVSFMSKPFNT